MSPCSFQPVLCFWNVLEGSRRFKYYFIYFFLGGGLPQYVPIKFSTFSMILECSRRFWNIVEGSRMFDHDFHFFKVFKGSGRGVTPIFPLRVSNLF